MHWMELVSCVSAQRRHRKSTAKITASACAPHPGRMCAHSGAHMQRTCARVGAHMRSIWGAHALAVGRTWCRHDKLSYLPAWMVETCLLKVNRLGTVCGLPSPLGTACGLLTQKKYCQNNFGCICAPPGAHVRSLWGAHALGLGRICAAYALGLGRICARCGAHMVSTHRAYGN